MELLLRRIERGRIAFDPHASSPGFREPFGGTRAPGLKVQRLKMQRTLATAMKVFPDLSERQMLCWALADMLIASFACESACLRLASLRETDPGSRRCALAEMAAYLIGVETEACIHQNMVAVLGACGETGEKVFRQLSAAKPSLPGALFMGYEILGAAIAEAGGYLW